MDVAPLLILVGLLFVKEAGVPIPVPGDLLVLGAGAAMAGQGLAAVAVLGAILIAGFAGGAVQFVLIRAALREPMLRLLARVGVPRTRLDALAERLRSGGSRGVAVARATPAVRVAAIAASGLASLPVPVFGRGLVAGNTLFVGAHFALGYVVGTPAIALLAGVSGLVILVVAIGVLAVVGALGLGAILARRARSRALPAVPAGAWLEAACPACLALDALAVRS